MDDLKFLGLQINQRSNDVFLSQSKYVKNLVKWSGLENAKHAKSTYEHNFL